MFSKHNVKIS